MLKKILLSLIFISLFPVFTHASEGSLLRIGNKYYDSFLEALANVGSNETIILIEDIILDKPININKTVNINLNGNDIVSPEKVFVVEGGVLNLSGKGTIRESKPNYGAIMIIGSKNANDKDYSIVNVSKDVTLEGWSGIFISQNNGVSYGVKVNLDGKIKSVNDTDGDTGVGVYVNGNIKNKENIPIINITDNAYITSTGNGLYIAGNSTFNISSAYIEGAESGIGIKSGNLNIDGATIVSEGPDKTPTEGYNNGIKASGTALQIESNNGYAGDINIDINSGTFKSKNSNVIYEYIGKGTNTEVNSIDISGGTFISDASKNIFLLSNPFKEKHPDFISGGKYSSDPTSYLKTGYTTSLNNDLYNVTKSAMLEVANIDSNNSNNSIKILIITISIIIISLLIYLNRYKLLKIFRKNNI